MAGHLRCADVSVSLGERAVQCPATCTSVHIFLPSYYKRKQVTCRSQSQASGSSTSGQWSYSAERSLGLQQQSTGRGGPLFVLAPSQSMADKSLEMGSTSAAGAVAAATIQSSALPTAEGETAAAAAAAAAAALAAFMGPSTDFAKAVPAGRLSLGQLIAPVADDLELLNRNLTNSVGERHPLLMAAAEQIFSAGGKRMRPALVFLVALGTAQLAGLGGIQPKHRRLAEITEMIHTASLMHDDVLDSSPTRRGKATVHEQFGTQVAVLAGDFLFAQASWGLANLDNLEVIKLISQVIADFANGEIQQAASLFDPDLTFEGYMDKSFFKTASLIAASAKSAAIFSGMDEAVKMAMYEYGRHLGLAFQVVDDILDFTQTSEQLGKPAGSDLASGNLTAPALYALHSERGEELRRLVVSEFVGEGSLERAVQLVKDVGGIEKAKALAREEGLAAKQCLQCLPDGEARSALHSMVDYVLERMF